MCLTLHFHWPKQDPLCSFLVNWNKLLQEEDAWVASAAFQGLFPVFKRHLVSNILHLVRERWDCSWVQHPQFCSGPVNWYFYPEWLTTAGCLFHPWGFYQPVWCSPLWRWLPSFGLRFGAVLLMDVPTCVYWSPWSGSDACFARSCSVWSSCTVLCSSMSPAAWVFLSTCWCSTCPKGFSSSKHCPALCQHLYWATRVSDSSDLQNKMLEISFLMTLRVVLILEQNINSCFALGQSHGNVSVVNGNKAWGHTPHAGILHASHAVLWASASCLLCLYIRITYHQWLWFYFGDLLRQFIKEPAN